jgi:hypothetical protein
LTVYGIDNLWGEQNFWALSDNQRVGKSVLYLFNDSAHWEMKCFIVDKHLKHNSCT